VSRAFDYCLKFVLRPDVEGGEVNDKRDPGGHTNRGVTQATLNQAREAAPHLNLPASVRDLTHENAADLYRYFYWTPIQGDALPLGVALMLFDSAVNQGAITAVRFLQRALNVRADGVMGSITVGAANRAGKELLTEFAARRMHHYMLLDQLDDTFGLGWARRMCRCLTAALAAPVEA
jgi:lysozyme family protein